jgi:alkylation response protein AidB-like acyl-CoA dehydrogenase
VTRAELGHLVGLVAERADAMDAAGCIDADVLAALRDGRWLGATAPAEAGGRGQDLEQFGLLNEALGAASSSVRALLTVHTMTSETLRRWGGAALREHLVPGLLSGARLAAFALTEEEAGSDAAALRTTAVPSGGGYRLDGAKSWVTFGMLADTLLVFAQLEGAPTAFAVDATADGVRRTPITDILGDRASMPARVELRECLVPVDARVGGVGMGTAVIAAHALCWGRYSVAWGCVGLGQACLDATLAHTAARHQFGRPLAQQPLVQRTVATMAVDVAAARQLCLAAARADDAQRHPPAGPTEVAKYFASTALTRAAAAALRLHGAGAWLPGARVQRLFRDAQAMEVIEGATEILQLSIAASVYRTRGVTWTT